METMTQSHPGTDAADRDAVPDGKSSCWRSLFVPFDKSAFIAEVIAATIIRKCERPPFEFEDDSVDEHDMVVAAASTRMHRPRATYSMVANPGG